MELTTFQTNNVIEEKYIRITEDTKIENIKDTIRQNLNKKIVIYNDVDLYNEHKYLSILKEIFSLIPTEQIDVQISVNNRELFNKYNFFLNTPNLNITIETDGYIYTKEEYLEENQKLENLIKPIKESTLSPYEKYIAVYNIVKHFKPYKTNDEKPNEDKELRYILNNEYIDCVGYSNLLKVLLDKIDINSMCLGVYAQEELEEDLDLKVRNSNHQRNIIKIDDEKYNIHGIYLADVTWDNNIEKDYYDYANLTFDKVKEASHLEKLIPSDYLLDFHNQEEFIEKINVYLRKLINKENSITGNEKKVINAYSYLYKKIMSYLLSIDYNKYNYFYNKYHKKIMEKINPKFEENLSKISSMIAIIDKNQKELNNEFTEFENSSKISIMMSNIDKMFKELDKLQNEIEVEEPSIIENKTTTSQISLSEIENIFSDFLTEYATYIIPLSNKKISNETLLTAAQNVKQEIDKYNQEQLNSWKEEVLEDREFAETELFLYSYNPNETRINYLETKEEQSKRR